MSRAGRVVIDKPVAELVGFRPGGDFTVGVEDELLLVDSDGELGGDSARLIASLGDLGPSTASPEIFLSQVEFNTPACRDASALGPHLHCCRARLVAAGQLAIATGVHPTAQPDCFERTRSPRYDMLADEFAGVLRTPTSAFQVHVGMPDKASLLAAYRRIRNELPVLRALGASSPFWHGRDSGLASARAALIRSYPRVGVPPVLRSYDEYESAVREEMGAGEVPDYTFVCWEVRPHPRFGTLEVRVMDAQPSLHRALWLVALVRGMAGHAAEGRTGPDLPPAVLAANDFRALRYGLDTRIVDVDGRMRPMRAIAADAIADARLSLAGEEDEDLLDAADAYLDAEPEPQRQRRIVAAHGMRGLLRDLVSRTVGNAWAPPARRRGVV